MSDARIPKSSGVVFPVADRTVVLRLPHGQACAVHSVLLWARAALTEASRFLPVQVADTIDQVDEALKRFPRAFDEAALGAQVTDEMVEAALSAYFEWTYRPDTDAPSAMRAALSAAFSTTRVCPRCNGNGETVVHDVCPACDGDGLLERATSRKRADA